MYRERLRVVVSKSERSLGRERLREKLREIERERERD